MRVNPKHTDFEAISRRSMQKDFKNRRTRPEKRNAPKNQNSGKITNIRIAHVNEGCQYARYSRYLVGKAVRCVDSKGEKTTSGWYEFVFDDDRKALNAAAGWSDNKKKYLLERPQLR